MAKTCDKFSAKKQMTISETNPNLNIIAMVVVVVLTEELFKTSCIFNSVKLRFLAKNGFRYLHILWATTFDCLKITGPKWVS